MKSVINRLTGIREQSFGATFLISFGILLAAVIAGVISSGGMEGETRQSIAKTVDDYILTGDIPKQNFFSALYQMWMYPAILFGFGLSAVGVAVIPAVLSVKGYIFAFTSATCINLYGTRGILLALAVTGIENLFLLPCMLILATDGLVTSLSIFGTVFGVGTRVMNTKPDYKAYTRKFIIVCAAVVAAVVIERIVSPGLFAFAVQTIK